MGKKVRNPAVNAVFFSVEKVSPLFMSGKLGSTSVIGFELTNGIEIANNKLLWLLVMSNSNQIALPSLLGEGSALPAEAPRVGGG
jgi:hypothetical protein